GRRGDRGAVPGALPAREPAVGAPGHLRLERQRAPGPTGRRRGPGPALGLRPAEGAQRGLSAALAPAPGGATREGVPAQPGQGRTPRAWNATRPGPSPRPCCRKARGEVPRLARPSYRSGAVRFACRATPPATAPVPFAGIPTQLAEARAPAMPFSRRVDGGNGLDRPPGTAAAERQRRAGCSASWGWAR